MTPQVPQWFVQAKVGMFYHFGLYTLLANTNENELRQITPKHEYRKKFAEFNPTRFNADQWVDCAISMGARYIVPTAKHAEGFCLWDSKLTDLKSTATPFGRDIIAELSAAAAKKGVKFCLYFNLETWLNDGNDVWNRQGMSYADFFEGQLTELLTGYGPIALIWFDHQHPELPLERFKKIIATIKRLQPECLVNDRGIPNHTPLIGDYITPERRIPDVDPSNDWFVEACDSMGAKSWGYFTDDVFFSASEMAKRLSLCRSKGYNFLINVEPMPDGTIRPECMTLARELGAWTRANQAAVDAGRCRIEPLDSVAPYQPSLGVSTIANNTLYLHLHQWPMTDEIFVKVTGHPVNATIAGERLRIKVEEKGLRMSALPLVPLAGYAPWIVAVEFDGVPQALPDPKMVIPMREGEFSLSPVAAEPHCVSGVFGLPCINRFPNGNISMGSLAHVNDSMTWWVDSPSEGEFDVHLSLGSVKGQSDASFELVCGSSSLEGRTWLTEHYSLPVRKSIGRVRLVKGENQIVLRVTEIPSGPSGAFSDVHGITLVPVGA